MMSANANGEDISTNGDPEAYARYSEQNNKNKKQKCNSTGKIFREIKQY